MHCPRPLLALLFAALLPVAIAPAHAAEPLVVAPHAAPATALLAHDHLVGHQPESTPIKMALTLPLRNTAALDILLHRLYTPGNPFYGHYLTPAQFDAQFGPTQADYDAVTSYLRSQGLTVKTYASRTMVGVSSTSGTIETAFHVKLNQYKTASGRVAYANTASPMLPATIASRVSGVVGLDNLIVPHTHLTIRPPTSILNHQVGNGPQGGLSPSDIKKIYNLNNLSLAGEGQSMALLELDGYDTGDIREYITQFRLPINPDDTDILVNEPALGFTGPSGTDGQVEVTLDIDMMIALCPRINHIYVYEADDNSAISILQLMTLMASDDFAQTMSCSWGNAEDIAELSLGSPTQYMALQNAQDAQLRKMSAQGQSFFSAAGDDGAYDDSEDLATPTISVDDPADEPYATAVGGTEVMPSNPGTANIGYGTETTWNEIASGNGAGGGGFSDFFTKPFYQYSSGSTTNPTNPVGATGDVSDVLSTIVDPIPSIPMRDLPDVSLNADPLSGYAIFAGITGQASYIVGGTSAAAPLWAAFTSLVNEARAADSDGVNPGESPGLPNTPVGFINPLIYRIGYKQYGSYANDFHDIADGSNNEVYVAQFGFDDATGWGSFNGANLLRDLAAYAPNTPTVTAPAITTFPPGFQMISEPQQFSGQTFAALFGLASPIPNGGPELFQWEPLAQTYANSQMPGSVADTIAPGQGYWLYVPNASAPGLTLATSGTTPAAPFTVSLQAGWNQIGDPFTTAETFSNISVTMGTTTTPLPNAGTSVYGTLYTYPAGATQYTGVNAGQAGSAMQPYLGYWIYAFQASTLTFN
jgi:subtilase family serine protease